MPKREPTESAAEEVAREAEDAETDVTDERAARRDSTAGDTLTPSPHAQRQASDPAGPEHHSEDDDAGDAADSTG
ncbi:hypothetical protein OYE22_33075 [Streptomyces sp. 71268]|uniref:hypothetical protein n=1 Tax=Streptomyces sp. 71268 TaxID=3002640 RepID=UPI0023F964AB|nr:hypothetical protein [Streptomyces sp. 71268]WEV29491.1 hypothetical protein OYE22_33075 [Streptomyces sp. 71268]